MAKIEIRGVRDRRGFQFILVDSNSSSWVSWVSRATSVLLITSLLIYDNLKFRSRLRGNDQERLLHQPTTVQGLHLLINHFPKEREREKNLNKCLLVFFQSYNLPCLSSTLFVHQQIVILISTFGSVLNILPLKLSMS